MTTGPSQEEIEGYIAGLTTASKWSSDILPNDGLGYLIGELESGDPNRVAAAITEAQRIIAAYEADYNNTRRPGEE